MTGHELYYLALDGRLMSVPIPVIGGTPRPGTPVALFTTRLAGTATFRQQYDVAPDGRFLMNVAVERSVTAPLTLLLNWRPR